mmetsp:Transcript_9609/g.16135  ORF Transcript_9609/g.16135 Transcript_9609/m.16135 type:complete len:81 (-) Transcript_9609:120-362(-)|eukprot:CAMPEP_0177775290 /NCGR_PEP_ID=MMETSP0491_2-20121128/14010_1 /TAXON_ID=63592 /ORGANISM="Tetraselmis chuii, Strain PLY429" /LENGTH=80 /DNA_ID=CAMNT_0019293823 /DNA_START=85 /DNA_END=327 /DNA_ORIENTATION=+
MSGDRPSELALDDKWDKCVDTFLRRAVYGTLSGGLAGLILFRGGGSRMASMTFGMGIGVGSAYEECSKELEEIIPSLRKE